jgi:uncharacterized protein
VLCLPVRPVSTGAAGPYTAPMSSREFDPSRLDVAAFAKEAGHLEGRWPVAPFERLAEVSVADPAAPVPSEIAWQARGERLVRGGEAQVWLALDAAVELSLECQRCLQPVRLALQIARRFRFVHGEDAAAQLDADSEDDVLALTRALDLRELVEDELLLALPIVPRHEVCPAPLPVAIGEDDGAGVSVDDIQPNPFAALAALKRGPLN